MRRWTTAVTMMIVTLAASLWVATPASAANTLTVTNAASYFSRVVPRGSLLALFTSQRVSGHTAYFNPWVRSSGALRVTASCVEEEAPAVLPILSIAEYGDGSQVNVYYPNAMGTEPWGSCANSGPSTITLFPDTGYGPPVSSDVVTVATHPGIFSGGSAPSGIHRDTSGEETLLTSCSDLVPRIPTKCRPRGNGGIPAEIFIYLTGAEWYLCTLCPAGGLTFELAPVVNGVVGAYVAQNLNSLTRYGDGVERAHIVLRPDVGPGEHRLRVRNSSSADIPEPLPIWFGQPA
jgi:hypothetical protein